jgi:hypothetical protein
MRIHAQGGVTKGPCGLLLSGCRAKHFGEIDRKIE